MLKLKRLLYILGLMAIGAFFAMMAISMAGLSDKIGKADIALVLGNRVGIDGTPSEGLRARLDKTIELYHAGYFPIIIVSGGIDRRNYDEARVMRNYLVVHGIPSENIIMDNAGINTFASAKNTLQIIQEKKLKSVFVISQYFHLPRARLALKRFGISPIYSASADLFRMLDLYSLPREVVAYVNYSLRHYEVDKPE